MPDQRSVMKEFRSLEQKRAAEGLSPAEEARLAKLRELIGPETGAGGLRGGFDVNAAAARLRESLLPGGLRNRPAPEPAPVSEPEPEPELSPSEAVASAFAAEPFAPLEQPGSPDPLFDPSSLGFDAPAGADAGVLGTEWDPGAGTGTEAAYDGSSPHDPAIAGYDPAAQGYDPAAQGYDPAAQGYDPAAQGYDPGGGVEGAYGEAPPDASPAEGLAAWDPGLPLDAGTPDPGAPYDPSAAAPYDADSITGYDPGAAPGWDPNAPTDAGAAPPWEPDAPFDPAAYPATPYDPGAAAAYDAGAPTAWDPNAPLDPNAAPAWDPNAPFDPGAPAAAWDPNAPFDPGAYAAPAQDAAPADAAYDPDAIAPDLGAPAWEAGAQGDAAAAPEGEAMPDAFAAEPAPDSGAIYSFAAPEAGAPADDGAGWDPSVAPFDQPVPGDDAGPFDAGALLGEPEPPFDPDAAPARGDDASLPPSGWEVAPPPPDAAPADAPLGEYDESGAAPALGEDAGLESALPLEPSVEAAGPDETEAAPLGEYDDTAGFSATAFPDVTPADLPIEPGGFEAARTIAPGESEGWQPEPVVDEGFLRESGGSFDAAAAAVAPEWAVAGEPAPWDPAAQTAEPAFTAAEAFAEPLHDAVAEPFLADAAAAITEGEAAPTDVDVSFDDALAAGQPSLEAAVGPAEGDLAADVEPPAPDLLGPAPSLDFSRPDLSEGQPEDDFAPPATTAAPQEEEEIPTIDGEEILEELPPEEAPGAPGPSLDFEPLVIAPPPAPRPVPAPAPAPPGPAVLAPPAPAAALVPPLPPLAPPPEEAAIAPPSPAGARVVAGAQRVVVHTAEGQVKRGILEDADLAAAVLSLAAQPGAAPEPVATERVKAIFFMLAPGEKAPAAEGKRVRVTFRDGRQIAGFSPDYDETGPGFFMVPGDTRTNTGRIWVYRASVKQVSVS